MGSSILSLDALQRAAIDALRRSEAAEDAQRTEELRAIADAFVSAREHFFTADHEVDWLGRTRAYKRWVGETMSLANVAAEKRSSIHAAIRYHVGNLLRDRLTPEQLSDLGLSEISPREKASERRASQSEVGNVTGAGPALQTDREIELLAQILKTALPRVSDDAVRELSAEARRRVHVDFLDVLEHAQRIVDVSKA